MAETILCAKHISKAFIGVQALDDVSVEIKSGEIHCLAGENGSGKSTFVKTAMWTKSASPTGKHW